MPVPGPVFESLGSSELTVIAGDRTGRAADRISRLLLELPDRRRLVSPGLASSDIAVVDGAGLVLSSGRRISMSKDGWHGHTDQMLESGVEEFSSFGRALEWLDCPSASVPEDEREVLFSLLSRTDAASTKNLVDTLARYRIIVFDAEGRFSHGLIFLSPRCCLSSAYFRSREPVRLCLREGIFWSSILSLRPERPMPMEGTISTRPVMADVIAAQLDKEDALSDEERLEIASNLSRIRGRLDYLVPY